MKKAFVIAQWEFFQTIKSKNFLLSLIITPLLFIGFSIFPSIFANKDDDVTKAIGMLDSSKVFEKSLTAKLEKYTFKDNSQNIYKKNVTDYSSPTDSIISTASQNNTPRFLIRNFWDSTISFDSMTNIANSAINKKEITSYIFIKEIAPDSFVVEIRGKSIGSFKDLNRFEKEINIVRREKILYREKLNNEIAEKISKTLEIKNITVDELGKTKDRDFQTQFFSSMVFVMLLFMVIMLTGGMLVRSLVEEKSNRLIEILISSCKSEDLLAGKIMGLTFLVLFELVVWTLVGSAFAGNSLQNAVNFANIWLIILYFIMGFFFYVAIFVGVGSIVNTEQEANQITSYLSMLAVAPMATLIPVLQNPDQPLVRILSYFPFTAAPIMMLRLNIGKVSPLEILGTFSALLFSIALCIFVSARIFRIGILSYGKMPSLKVLWSWIKNPD